MFHIAKTEKLPGFQAAFLFNELCHAELVEALSLCEVFDRLRLTITT